MKAVRYAAAGAVALGLLSGCSFLSHSSSSTPAQGATAPSSMASSPGMGTSMAPTSMAPTGMGTSSMGASSMAPSSMAPSSMGASSMMPTNAAAAARCTSLAVSKGMANGTAGSTYVTLVFTNNGMAACTVAGYPGVALTTARTEASQVGASASRDAMKTAKTVTLAPGGSTTALLRVADAGNFGMATVSTSYLEVFSPTGGVAYLPYVSQGVASTSVDLLTVGPVGA